MAYCSAQARRASIAIRASVRVRHLIESGMLTVPEADEHCFQMTISRGSGKFTASFAVSPDRMGNRRMDGVGASKPPSTLEIYLMDFVGDFSDVDAKFGYDGDVRDFSWNSTPRAPEGGFAEVIDEIVRLCTILGAPVSS